MAVETLVQVSRKLSRAVDALSFGPPTAFVYNPLAYARAPHEEFLSRYGGAPKEVVLLGMNPGPFGMAQTGVPFGEVAHVRDWLGIEGNVGKPPKEHPKRPIDGFACTRSEVSGARIWAWAKGRFGTPERFFKRFFVVNYCPLVFMEEGGKNRTPDKLPAAEVEPLTEACDRALRETVALLKPKFVIGVGAYAEAQARRALEGSTCTFGRILHPSPASPAANRGWAPQAERDFEAAGVRLPA
ncbi:MAG: hypothetical protein R3A78_13500 [Polyangiales bacterium]